MAWSDAARAAAAEARRRRAGLRKSGQIRTPDQIIKMYQKKYGYTPNAATIRLEQRGDSQKAQVKDWKAKNPKGYEAEMKRRKAISSASSRLRRKLKGVKPADRAAWYDKNGL